MKAVAIAVLAILPWASSSSERESNPLDGKIVVYSAQSETAIIDRGKDHGVLVGMKYTVYRGDRFIASGIVKETAKDWSALTIEMKSDQPQAGDDVSSQILSPVR
jgi:hypothetical protein